MMGSSLHSSTYVVPSHGDIIGEIQYGYSEIGETLAEAGDRFDLGYVEMHRANPQLEPHQSLSAHTRLVIPSQHRLPQVPRQGIVINLAQYRLYYFPPNENIVYTYPIGIGRKGWSTPLGVTKVISKETNPIWHPTKKIRELADENGFPLPEEFPAGPNNPLGQHVLRLGWPTYLIHGSNAANSVGRRVSAGCIRMRPQDIEYLSQKILVGTQVRVVNAL